MTAVAPPLGTRAVLRSVEAGQLERCPWCDLMVKFRARHRDKRIVANVYANGKWNRVEVWHDDCYLQAGEPYGAAT